MNKKFLALLSAGALTATLLAGCGSGGNTESSTAEPSGEEGATLTTIESGKLIMSTNAQFPPYELVSDGEGYEGTGYEGIDVEIAYALAQKLGLELVIDDMDFDGALLAVQNGKSDMVMAGVTVNEERLVNMDFTDSYANGVQVVIVPEDSDIQTIEDLEGKKIGTQRGTTGYIYCSDTPENGGYGEDAVTGYEDGATAVQALMNGQADCVVIDNAPAQEYVKANPGLKILDTEFANEDYAIGVAKPVSVRVDTFGTGTVSDEHLSDMVESVFDLRPAAIIRDLDLRRPIYRQLAAYGHFGRDDLDLPWERTDKAEALLAAR